MEVRENQAVAVQARNRFDRMEIAGALGDLGTLLPSVGPIRYGLSHIRDLGPHETAVAST